MKKLSIALAIAALSIGAFAQDKVILSTGTATGTYSSFLKSIQAVCGDSVTIEELNSSGSDQNIDNMINRAADGGFVQSDTLQFTAMNDPRASDSQIRVLVPMYPEEVHVVALRDLSKVSGGVNLFGKNIGGNKQVLNSLADLEGVKVGTWGGSTTTARAIAYLGSVKYETVQFPDDKSAKAALDKGEIAAIIAVGGQPLKFVSSLNQNYKLLKIDSGLADKVKAYSKARITYRNLDSNGVDTISARSMLVVRNYATPSRKERLAALKQCILKNEGTFKEGTGHHPKWSDVDFNALVSWQTYDVSSVTPAAAPSKKK